MLAVWCARLTLIVAATCVLPVPATALPGQSIPAFKTWAAKQKLLTGVAKQRDEFSGLPAFRLETADRGIAWSFYATTDGKTIRRESLAVSQVGQAVGTAPIRRDGNGYGYRFLAALYGPAVARDFKAARLVATVKDPTNGQTTHFYRGARYGYALTNGLVLETFAALKTDIALAQRCAAHPENCSE